MRFSRLKPIRNRGGFVHFEGLGGISSTSSSFGRCWFLSPAPLVGPDAVRQCKPPIRNALPFVAGTRHDAPVAHHCSAPALSNGYLCPFFRNLPIPLIHMPIPPRRLKVVDRPAILSMRREGGLTSDKRQLATYSALPDGQMAIRGI